MKWLSNTLRPEKYIPGKITEEEYRKWFEQFIIGEPQSSKMNGAYTVAELKAMGFVGLYAPDNPELTATIDAILNGNLIEYKTLKPKGTTCLGSSN